MQHLLNNELLAVQDVGNDRRGVPVLRGISFRQQRGEKIAVAGETGSGKSTLLRIIAGLIQADRGTVLFDGGRVAGPLEKLIPGHPKIAYLSQDFELRNNYRIEEVLDYANQLGGGEAADIFAVCRISHLMKRRTDEVSGGEKQRVALARLLIMSPRLLLLDEPFSNLDPIHKSILKSVIRDTGEKLGLTSMLISHDPTDLLSWADRILVMRGGQLVAEGTPGQLYRHPQDAYIAGLFGKYNEMPAALMASLSGNSADGNNQALFLRPEYLVLQELGQGRVAVTIKEVLFMGSYLDVEVEVAGFPGSFTVRTQKTGFRVGEAASLSLGKP